MIKISKIYYAIFYYNNLYITIIIIKNQNDEKTLISKINPDLKIACKILVGKITFSIVCSF